MIRVIFLAVLLTICSVSFSQAPEGFKYQAVIRDANNIIITNQAIGVRLNIKQGSSSGVIVYSETFSPTTNAYGLVNLEVGAGNTLDDFTTIDWSNGPYFIETAIDLSGGSSYIPMGTSQLMSVPYALYAKSSGNPIPGPQGQQGSDGLTAYEIWINQGNTGTETDFINSLQGPIGVQGVQGSAGNGISNTIDNGDGTLTYVYDDGSTITTPNLVGPSGPQGIQGPQGDTGVGIVYTVDNGDGTLTFVYSDSSSIMSSNLQGPAGPQGANGLQGQSGTSACNIIKSGDGRIVVYTSNSVKGFGKNNTSGSGWYTTTINGTILGALASDTNIVIYTATDAYGFGYNSTSGSGWYSKTLSAPITGFEISSGRVVIYNDSDAYGFGFNFTSGSSWYSKAISGLIIYTEAAGNRIVIGNASDAYGFGFNSTSGSNWYSTTLSPGTNSTVGTH